MLDPKYTFDIDPPVPITPCPNSSGDYTGEIDPSDGPAGDTVNGTPSSADKVCQSFDVLCVGVKPFYDADTEK